MAGEDKVWRLLLRYRTVFLFLGLVLIVQFLIALRVIFIAENVPQASSSPPFLHPVRPTSPLIHHPKLIC
jgi:hypothetical protein